MIHFQILSQSNVLVVRFGKSESYVMPQELLEETERIKNNIAGNKFSQIIFVGDCDFWHKNIRIESFKSLHECMSWAQKWRSFLKFIKELPTPCYAFVQGACDGVGLELVVACRFRIATRTARFACQDVRHGHLPVGGLLFRLISLVGLDKTLKLLLLGDELDAWSAKRAGLIHEVSDWLFDGRDMALPSLEKKSLKYSFFLEDLPWARGMMFRFWRKEILGRFRGHFRSPLKLLEVIERGWFKGGETRTQLELEAFSELVFSAQANVLEHIHSKLRAFFQVENLPRKKILFLKADKETLQLMKLLAPFHSLSLYEEKVELVDHWISIENNEELVFEHMDKLPLNDKYDFVFKRLPEQGIVFECLAVKESIECKVRFFSPLTERKIIEIYQSNGKAPHLLKLFTSLGKFPLVIGGEDTVCDSPVIRMALAVHDEALLMVQEGHALDVIGLAFKDLGMRPSVFDLWKESSSDQMNTFKTKLFKRFPERFVKNIGIKSPVKTERFSLRLLKEALHLLNDGLVRDPLMIDLLMIYGLGYPRYQGGLLYQVDNEGVALWLEKMKTLEQEEGQRFAPPDFLQKVVQAKGRIYDRTVL